MRLFFATDIHGANRVYNKFLNSLQIYKTDVGIIGGDITGKMMVPAVENGDGSFSIEYYGQKVTVPREKVQTELSQMESFLNDTGFYTYRTTADEFTKLQTDQDYRDKIFQELMLKRIQDWIVQASTKLKGTSSKVFITGGNDDLPAIENFLKPEPPLTYCESRVINVSSDHEMISSGYANLTPWKCPRDITEDELEKKLEAMASQISNHKMSIFNFHVPPINTCLDECPKVDQTADPPKVIAGEMTAGGSVAVRKIIEKYQPLITLHGHIHESRGAEKIGRSLCLNPGSEYGEGVLRGVIVNLDRDKVKGYQFISSG